MINDTNIGERLDFLRSLQRRMSAYDHAMALIQFDGATSAPAKTADNRAAAMGVLSEEIYRIGSSDETVAALEELDSRKDELSQKERRQVYLLLRDIREMKKIPQDEYAAYQRLAVKSDAVWHEAKERSDFGMFLPYLEKMFETEKRFALYAEPDKDPYDHCLSKYEEGLTRETLDGFFGSLRSELVPLIAGVSRHPQPDDGIRFGDFPADRQEKLAYRLMETIGLDMGHVGLSTTEHPFTTSFGSHSDVRITTHYHKDDFVCSMYSVIHEGGHALYDSGSDDELAYTVLDGGASMSVHESQSRFYENIIGRSRAFCELIFPTLTEIFPEHMKGRTPNELYLAVNKAEPSLIRTEADELTYSLHVMIRYELEKAVFDGSLKVKDLPFEWNRMYKEYLGVDVPDDRRGVLQDSHWSGGLIGYFPSYALGNAYGAQLYDKMKESLDVEKLVASGRISDVNAWNRENIWRHGRTYSPSELLTRVFGGPFDPSHYVGYLRTKYADIYGL